MLEKWTKSGIKTLFELPLFELIHQAYTIHKENFHTLEMELCTLCNIKVGGCPEDCKFCNQSAHYKTGLKREKLLDINEIVRQAKEAKKNGAQRFCMGAAWRGPPKKELPQVLEAIKQVKALGLETCVTLGLLDQEQARQLSEAGLDFYNHNLETSPNHYEKIVSTHKFADRKKTLQHVREAGINVCAGGILGMGETRQDRIDLIFELSNLPEYPPSVPINRFRPMQKTPLEDTEGIDNFEFIKTIAVARITMPRSKIRLSCGRTEMSDEMQAWCFMAGANSIFYGEKLLTSPNPKASDDLLLLERLGIKSEELPV